MKTESSNFTGKRNAKIIMYPFSANQRKNGYKNLENGGFKIGDTTMNDLLINFLKGLAIFLLFGIPIIGIILGFLCIMGIVNPIKALALMITLVLFMGVVAIAWKKYEKTVSEHENIRA